MTTVSLLGSRRAAAAASASGGSASCDDENWILVAVAAGTRSIETVFFFCLCLMISAGVCGSPTVVTGTGSLFPNAMNGAPHWPKVGIVVNWIGENTNHDIVLNGYGQSWVIGGLFRKGKQMDGEKGVVCAQVPSASQGGG